MILTTPIWLWLLVPWGMLVLWVLVVRKNYAPVSTTQFWDINEPTRSPARGFKRPPIGLVFLLLGMLAAIFAAAGLTLGNPSSAKRFTLIIDRNIGSMTTLQKEMGAILEQVRNIAGESAMIDLVTVPDRGMEEVPVVDCRSRISQLKSTAIDTSTAINQIISSELSRNDHPVYIVTSQSVLIQNPRLHLLAPNIELQNVGIEKFTVTPGDNPQALVRVRNHSNATQTVLQVDDVMQRIDLPGKSGMRDYVVDLKKLSSTSSARLLNEDDIPADNAAYLSRRGIWPKLVGQKGLPDGIERMIEVYTRKRPPEDDAVKVYVATSLSDVPEGAAALILPTGIQPAGAKLEFDLNEKLATGVNWDAVLKNAQVSPAPTEGWSAVLSVDGRPIISRRELPRRQIWVGIDNPRWPLRTDYVIFFSDVFDYLGATSRAYSSEEAREPGVRWSRMGNPDLPELEAAPGLYRTPEGVIAMNMAVFQQERPAEAQRPEITAQESKIAYNLVRPMMFGAMLFVLMGAFCLTRTRDRVA